MATLKNPFMKSGLNYYTLGKKITSCDYEPFPEGVPGAVQDLGECGGVEGQRCLV